MDNTSIALYIHELRNQCMYMETAYRVLNQSVEENVQTGVFYAGQSILLAASQISGLLWPSRARARKRGEALRQVLDLPEKHALNDKRLSTMWEHSDEKLEDWIGATKGENVIFDHLGPMPELVQGTATEENVYRSFDPATQVFLFRGNGYNLQALANAVGAIYSRLDTAHRTVFPEYHQQHPSDSPANNN